MSENEPDGTPVPESVESDGSTNPPEPAPVAALPALPVAMYPAEDDETIYIVDLELSFCSAELLVKKGIVVDCPQMLNWTQHYNDEGRTPRRTQLKDVIEWYKRPGKTDAEGETKAPEFRSAKIVGIL